MKHFCLILCFFISFSSYAQDHGDYPLHWWKAVDKSTAPEWEILPQDARPGEVILSKRNELGLLSNFAHTPFEFEGQHYESLEGFWQMMKFPESNKDPRATAQDIEWPFTRAEVSQMIGFDAKRAGSQASENMKELGINWVSYKGRAMVYRTLEKGNHYKLIKKAMKAKLMQNKAVYDILLRTGDLKLRPDHDQGEIVPPAWKYHEIWMEFRNEIQNPK